MSFNTLPESQRVAIQVLLSAAGYWPAVPNSRFNGRLFAAITRFQQDGGEAATGDLTSGQAARLRAMASPVLSGWGFRPVAHPTRGYPIWVPFGLGLVTSDTAHGLRFADQAGHVQLDYEFYADMPLAQANAAWLAKMQQEGDSFLYKAARPNFFVFAASNPNGRFRYVRFQQDREGILGFSLSFDDGNPVVHGDRLETLISASLWSAMTPGAPHMEIPYVEPPTTRMAALPTPPPPAAEPGPAPSPVLAPKASSGEESSGTGFFVTRDGTVLTNNHVVRGCQSVEVRAAGSTIPARIVANDEDNDLSLLKVALAVDKVAALRPSVRLGEQVAAFGFPLAGLLSTSGSFTLGNVTALVGLNDNTRYLQISTPIQPGNSGGPLVDGSGNVVGVVRSKLNALTFMVATGGDVPQNVNFAIKSSVVGTFLESNGVKYEVGALGAILQPADLADLAKAMSVYVMCHGA